jgi:Co/Zn/Cd efflux system component
MWQVPKANVRFITVDTCCESKEEELRIIRAKHKNVLTIVLVVNAVLFVVEATAGLVAHSTALLDVM